MRVFGFDVHQKDLPPNSEQLATLWRPYVETCIAAFGPNRAMFESNFPVDKGSYGYGVFWNACKRLAQGASAAEKADLFHGTASGQMQVFEVRESGGTKEALQVFGGNFRDQYPPHGPVPADSLSSKMFQKRFIDNLSDRLGGRFYDYELGDEM